MQSGWLRWAMRSDAPASVILIRLMVGLVFVSEGLQKFINPEDVGSGRFERMGYSNPELVAYFVACFEIGCGALITVGLLTRAAAVPLIVIMLTALVTTKLPILLGQDLWGFQVRKMSEYGFWAMAHETRTDWAMLLGSLYLVIVGGGRWSVDTRLVRTRQGELQGDQTQE